MNRAVLLVVKDQAPLLLDPISPYLFPKLSYAVDEVEQPLILSPREIPSRLRN